MRDMEEYDADSCNLNIVECKGKIQVIERWSRTSCNLNIVECKVC